MNDIEKAIKSARAAQASRIYNSFPSSEKVYGDKKIEKAIEEDLNPFDVEAEEAEKSDVMDALSYQGEIKVTKTGKEIKDQVDNVLLPDLTSSLAAKIIEADNKIKHCGDAPTENPDRWWTAGVKIDCGYKIYEWRETNVNRDKGVCYDTLSAEDAKDKAGNIPENQEVADARKEYNSIVEAICNIKADIKACEILKTLSDDKEYELSPRQFVTFRF